MTETITFRSILFVEPGEGVDSDEAVQPACFADLNLDQIVHSITASKAEYNLKPFFHRPLTDIDGISYRHEVMRDLEDAVLLGHIRAFAKGMLGMREYRAQATKLHYRYQKEQLFVDAVRTYCHAVAELTRNLSCSSSTSRGLTGFRDYLADYLASERFKSLLEETKALYSDLSEVAYCIHIKSSRVTVRTYEGEPDYSEDVEETFRKFRQGAPKDYRVEYSDALFMNHVEAQILACVARLYPELFDRLDAYCEKHADYLDKTIAAFDREIQFYLAYIEYIGPLKQAGLNFSLPRLSKTDKRIQAVETFDLALASKLRFEGSTVVTNDFELAGKERIFLVSGPNQGGKTTFSRLFGQLHYLASLGYPVPGRETRLFLPDAVLTHYEKEESIETHRGKLEDDLVRIHRILDQATANSIVILNEIFNSTTAADALFLSREVLQRLIRLDVLCVCVTFLDELTSLGDTVVSMVSAIVPDNPAQRTYKIERRPADGRAYAIAIAEKYGLTYRRLKERIPE